MGAANDIHNIRLTSSFVTGLRARAAPWTFQSTIRSRVSNFMNKFRDLGFINYSGSSIEVHSALLSVLLNDKPQIRRDDATDADEPMARALSRRKQGRRQV